MVVVPLEKGEYKSGKYGSGELSFEAREDADESVNWVRYAAAGTLAAGGALLVSGHRRIGLIAALSGAALALIDQQDAVINCWNRLPEFLDELQGTLSKTQAAVEDISIQSQKLRQALGK